MSPVSPPAVRPGVWLKVSQMDGVRPSSRTAPSIWYAEVAAPQRKTEGKATGVTGVAESGMEALPLWSLRTDESADEEEEGRAGPYRTGVGREDGEGEAAGDGLPGAGTSRPGGRGRQPFTAPCMMPPTICLPKMANTISSGSVPSSAPAMIRDWSGV